MPIGKGFKVDIWTMEEGRPSSGTLAETSTYSLLEMNVPCFWTPIRPREKVSIGIDLTVDMRHHIFAENIARLTADSILFDRTDNSCWHVDVLPVKSVLPKAYTICMTSRQETMPEELRDYYGL